MEQLLNIIRKFPNLKVLIVGDVMLDEYIAGRVERISQEAPIPILDVREITYLPGGAANAAHNVRSLGGKVILAGVIGSDEKGKTLKEVLEKRGIDASGLIIDPQRKTTLKSRAVAQNQQIVRIDIEDRKPIEQATEEKILHFIKSQIGKFNSIVISDYAKGVITPNLSQSVIQLARQNNILCLVDPKGYDYTKYKNCNIITPNIIELAQALKIPFDQLNSESKFLQAGKMLLTHVVSDNVLVTQKEKGMTLFERSGHIFHQSAINKKAIDVSGAGDTAIGAFALALATGADLKQALIIASHACAIEVGKIGTAVVSPEELEESLRNFNHE